MSEDNSYIEKTLEDLRRQVEAKLDEARIGLAGMNAVERSFGLPITSLQDLAGGLPSAAGASAQVQPGNHASPKRMGPVRPDEFLGMEPMEAAKKYMQRAGQAIDFDEIADAVQRGGAVVVGSGWRERLETSLMRASRGIIKIGEKTYGLEEFYSDEQIRRIRAARRASRGTERKKKAKRKPKPKVVPKAAKEPLRLNPPPAEPKAAESE